MSTRRFHWYPQHLAVVKLPPESPLPPLGEATLFSLTRTPSELSLVVAEGDVPSSAVEVSAGWRALAVEGPLEFSLVGILAEIATALADAGVSLFALSTFDTDLILVAATDAAKADAALCAAGWRCTGPSSLPQVGGGGGKAKS